MQPFLFHRSYDPDEESQLRAIRIALEISPVQALLPTNIPLPRTADDPLPSPLAS